MELITVTSEKGIRVIQVTSLLAIKVENYICTFYLENGEKFSCSKSLKEIGNLLPVYFCCISRNTVINIKKIRTVELKQRKIELVSGHIFPYSRRNAKLVKEKLRHE